jgi:hypothetical protein
MPTRIERDGSLSSIQRTITGSGVQTVFQTCGETDKEKFRYQPQACTPSTGALGECDGRSSVPFDHTQHKRSRPGSLRPSTISIAESSKTVYVAF